MGNLIERLNQGLKNRLRSRKGGSDARLRLWLLAETADRVTVWHEVSPQGDLVGARQKETVPWKLGGSATHGSVPESGKGSLRRSRVQQEHLVLSISSGDKDLALYDREGWGGAAKRLAGAWPGQYLVRANYTHTGVARSSSNWLRGWRGVNRGNRSDLDTEQAEMVKPSSLRWLYATDQARIREIGPTARMLSLRALLREALMRDHAASIEPEFQVVTPSELLVTVVFSVGEEVPGESVLLLFHVTSQFEIKQYQYTALGGKTRLKSLTDTFASRCGLNPSEYRAVAMTGHELVAGIMATPEGDVGGPMLQVTYPAEPKILGLEASHFWRITASASICVLCAELVWTGYAYLMTHITAQDTLDTSVQSSALQERYQRALQARWGTMVQAGSVDPAKAVDYATAVYRDGLTVEIDADRSRIGLTQKITLSNEEVDQTFLGQLLKSPKLPAGCSQKSIESNRQLSEVFIHVECQSVDLVLRDSLDRGIR